MPLHSFDPETLTLMGRALEDAWTEIEARSGIRAEPENSGIRRALALRIMTAVRAGQRDPQRLRDVALHVVEGCRITRADAPVHKKPRANRQTCRRRRRGQAIIGGELPIGKQCRSKESVCGPHHGRAETC